MSVESARKPITLGTRASALARWQAKHIATLLSRECGVPCEIVDVRTSGDETTDRPIAAIGAKGVFTRDLEDALREGRIDAAVHSLKDLPTDDPDGTVVAALLSRGDPSDVLVTKEPAELESLAPGSRVGTGSVRRRAQLQALGMGFDIIDIRGNVDTRIEKVLSGEYDATILAAAGVNRLGLAKHVSQSLPLDLMLPAPGQAALAVQCRADYAETREALGALDSRRVRAEATAERAFLAALGGGCSAPIAALARFVSARQVTFTGRVLRADGSEQIQVKEQGSAEDAVAIGQRAAEQALAQGARELLA